MPFIFNVSMRIAVIYQHLFYVVEVLSGWGGGGCCVVGGEAVSYFVFHVWGGPRSAPFPFNLPFIPSFQFYFLCARRVININGGLCLWSAYQSGVVFAWWLRVPLITGVF